MSNDFVPHGNGWMHRPAWKAIANTILRGLQFYTDRPFVFISDCDISGVEPVLIRYRFGRIQLVRQVFWRGSCVILAATHEAKI